MKPPACHCDRIPGAACTRPITQEDFRCDQCRSPQCAATAPIGTSFGGSGWTHVGLANPWVPGMFRIQPVSS